MNAIIMAAGLGSRFKELTKHHHKALLPINGVPNLERTITMLQAANINEVHIVTGYLANQFNYLQDRFPDMDITMHCNDHYADYNNRYSFQLALPFFGDSFVIDADTVLRDNVFNDIPTESTYLTILRTIHGTEWCPQTSTDGRVTKMLITDQEIPSMSGISFWNKATAEIIKNAFPQYATTQQLKEKRFYWDDIPVAMLDSLSIFTHEVASSTMYEMDTQDNYRKIQELLQED